MRPQPTESMWVQRDGTPIWIWQMEDSHLLNTVRMLRRNAEKKAQLFSDDPHSPEFFDDGNYPFIITADEILAGHVCFPTMLLELRRRKLEELPL